MDVWFDSGVTHTAVVEARSDELGHLPVELYLEGSDQHRGWFQSSLLTSVAAHGKAPYKSVLTHGFVLDPNGRKMSKSLGNVVDPNAVIKELGADVLRLWVASVDYSVDVRIGKETLSQLAEVYRKVRNSLRFILGNLAGFDAELDIVDDKDLSVLDRYVLHRLHEVVGTLTEAFDRYEFHRYYQVLQNFCVTELSALYFDVTKDILYTAPTNGPQRRGVQTVLFGLLETLTPMLVPVMPHLAEDIYQNTPTGHRPRFGMAQPPASVLLAPWPQAPQTWHQPDVAVDMQTLLSIKETVNLALEAPRREGVIGSSLAAAVSLSSPDSAIAGVLSRLKPEELAQLFIVSSVVPESSPDAIGQAKSEAFPGLAVAAFHAPGSKCQRCWKILPTVGQDAAHSTLCHHCVAAVNG